LIKELPNALWGLRTQPTKPMGQSPYFLVYGSEAILPADVMWDSPAVEQYDEGISEDSKRVDIDRLKEAHCATLVQSARYLEGIRLVFTSTHSLSTILGAQVYPTTPRPVAVSGLRVQALVSGLLYPKIQR
jgi:hypothetical protein